MKLSPRKKVSSLVSRRNTILSFLGITGLAGMAYLASILMSIENVTSIVWNSNSATATSTTCSEGEALSISFSPSGTGDVALQVLLGDGMSYDPTSVVVSGGATLSSDDTVDPNDPIFTLSVTGGTVNVTFDRVAGCQSRDYQIGGGTFQDTARLFDGAVQIGGDSYSNNYQIQYAAVSLAGITNSPTSASVGGTVTRSLTVTNGSFGYLSSFTFAEVITAGDLSFSNFVIDPSGSAYSIPSGDITLSSGGDSVIIVFDQSLISQFVNSGSDADLFEQGESFELSYDVLVNTCGAGTSINSQPTIFWGCGGTVCQSYSETSTISLSIGEPSIKLVGLAGPNDGCYGYGNGTQLYTAMFINEGTGPAIIQSTRVDFQRNYMGYDPSDVVYSINSGPDISISSGGDNQTPTFASCLIGVGANLVNREVWTNLPIIPAGDTLKLKFNIYRCCPSECYPYSASNFLVWGIMEISKFTYTNQCGDNANYTNRSRVVGNLVSSFKDAYSIPANMIEGASASNVIVDISKFSWSNGMMSTTDGYIELVVNFPGQVDFGGSGVGDISWIDANGDVHTPSYSDFQDGMMTIRWSNMTDRSRVGQLIFPIVTDCSETATDGILDYHLYLYPDTSCTENCRLELSCFSEELNILCGAGPCADGGINNVSYRFERKNIGEFDMDNNGCPDTDNDCDGVPGGGTSAPTANESFIRKDRALNGDTVISIVEAAIKSSVANPTWAYIYYENNFSDISKFDFVEATLSVYDFSTGTTYQIPAGEITPTITGDQAKYDLSPVSLASLPGGFTYAEDDTLILDIRYTVDQPGNSSELITTDNKFYTATSPDPGSENGFACNVLVGNISVVGFSASISNSDDNFEDCTPSNPFGHINVNLNSTWNGEQYFSYEYRNLFKPTSFSVEIPEGYSYSSATFTSRRATSGSSIMNQTAQAVSPTSITPNIDGSETYTFDLTVSPNKEIFTEHGGTIFLSDEGHFQYPVVNIQPDCESSTSPGVKFTFEGISQNDGSSLVDTRTNTWTNQLPALSLTPANPIQSVTGSQVTWDVSIKNLSSASSTENTWIYLESPSGLLGSSVLEVKESSTTFTANADGFFELGSFGTSETRTFSITADVQNCSLDTMYVSAGYSCVGYPSSMAEYACTPLSQLLEVQGSPSQISTSITDLASTPSDPSDGSSAAWGISTVDMCSAFPVEVRLVSGLPGELSNVVTYMKNLVAGGGPGLDFVSGSGYIEYPVGTTPRAFSAAADASLVGEIGGPLYSFDLAEIDPTNFDWAGTDLLPGVGSTDNQVILRFSVSTNCDILSGDGLTFNTYADRACGASAIGNGESVSAFAVDITGVVKPYTINIVELSLDDFEGCSDQKTATINFSKLGTSAVSSTDSISIVLPAESSYAGNLTCVTTPCPTGAPAISTILGVTKLTWPMPSMSDGDETEFTFDIDYAGSDCSDDAELIQVIATSTQTIFCTSAGTNCPSSKVSLGGDSEPVSYLKPVLGIQLNSFLIAGQDEYEYSLTVDNSGSISTDDVITVHLYEYDPANDSITGPALDTITTAATLGSGASEILTGNLVTSNQLPNGVVAIIDRDLTSNCSCPDPTSINQSPWAEVTNVFPVELSYFNTKTEECSILLEWETLQEVNSDYFLIEYSTNGTSFTPLATVKASGNSEVPIQYTFAHHGTTTGTYFYRLKEYDLNGTEYVFNTVEESTTCEDFSQMEIYPNPTADGRFVVVMSGLVPNESVTLEVRDLQGRLLKQTDVGNWQSQPRQNIDISDQPDGVYYVRLLRNNAETLTMKLVKANR